MLSIRDIDAMLRGMDKTAAGGFLQGTGAAGVVLRPVVGRTADNVAPVLRCSHSRSVQCIRSCSCGKACDNCICSVAWRRPTTAMLHHLYRCWRPHLSWAPRMRRSSFFVRIMESAIPIGHSLLALHTALPFPAHQRSPRPLMAMAMPRTERMIEHVHSECLRQLAPARRWPPQAVSTGRCLVDWRVCPVVSPWYTAVDPAPLSPMICLPYGVNRVYCSSVPGPFGATSHRLQTVVAPQPTPTDMASRAVGRAVAVLCEAKPTLPGFVRGPP